jgi:hypothetical protein
MRGREKRLRRLLRLMRQMKQLEEWELQRLDHEIREAAARRRSLIEAMENDIFRSRMLADLIARSLRSATERETLAREEQGAARARLAEWHRQEKQVARMENRTARARAKRQERDALFEAIERAVCGAGSGENGKP